MAYTVGEFLDFKAEALTSSIRQIGIGESLWALNNVFNGPRKQLIGTDKAEWIIARENRKRGKFSIQGNPSRKMEPRGHRKLSAQFGHIFMSTVLDEAVLLWVKSADDNEREHAMGHILEKQADLVSMANILLEWACWEALQGSIAINHDEPEGLVKFDADFGFRTSHKTANGTLDWSLPGSLILTDPATPAETWDGLKRLIMLDSGMRASEIVMNADTNKYLFGNTEVKALYSDRTKDVLLDNAVITRLAGLDVATYEAEYEDDTGGTTTPFVPDEKVILLPAANMRQSFQLFEGEVLIPDKASDMNFRKTTGMASWVKFNEDPAEVRIYLKWNVLPVPMDPDAVVSRDVKI